MHCFHHSKQCRPWWNIALCAISSRPLLFVKVPFIERIYGIQPHEMFKKQNICNLQRIPLLCIRCECNNDIELSWHCTKCIVLDKMSAHPWKYWLSAYRFLPYCLVKSSIEIHKCIFGLAAIHQYWLTQFYKAFLNSQLLDCAILVDFQVK